MQGPLLASRSEAKRRAGTECPTSSEHVRPTTSATDNYHTDACSAALPTAVPASKASCTTMRVHLRRARIMHRTMPYRAGLKSNGLASRRGQQVPWTPGRQVRRRRAPYRRQIRRLYCEHRLQSEEAADYFVPRSRHPNDEVRNLMSTHSRCNAPKSHHLAGADHVEKWHAHSYGGDSGVAIGEIAASIR